MHAFTSVLFFISSRISVFLAEIIFHLSKELFLVFILLYQLVTKSLNFWLSKMPSFYLHLAPLRLLCLFNITSFKIFLFIIDYDVPKYSFMLFTLVFRVHIEFVTGWFPSVPENSKNISSNIASIHVISLYFWVYTYRL